MAIFTAEVDQINLVLYNQMHINQALELIKRVPGSMEVLTVGLIPTEGDQERVPAIPPADPTIVQAIDHSQQVEGEIPPEIHTGHWPWVCKTKKSIVGSSGICRDMNS